MKKIAILILFFRAVFSVKSFGQVGCLVGSTFYRNATGGSGGVWYDWGGSYPNYNTPTPTTAPACPRASLGSATGGRCRFDFWSPGLLYNYTLLTAPIGCPIDDHIYGLILLGSGLGFLYLRKIDLNMPWSNFRV